MKRKRDVIDLFEDHVRAFISMSSSAFSAGQALKAGKIAQARRDLEKAMHWKRRREQIEAEYETLRSGGSG